MNSETKNLFGTVAEAVKRSDNLQESIGQGFAFPVPKEIRDLPEDVGIEADVETIIGKKALLKAALEAVRQAWEKAIDPQLEAVRNQILRPEEQKGGTDFFTQADTSSEKLIRDYFFKLFGEDHLRIFGEEANRYLGNTHSRIGIRIDPIDGTESMKFGKTPDWSIMVGVYEGTLEKERQVVGVVYFPERGVLMYQIDELPGIYIGKPETGESQCIKDIPIHNHLKNIVTCFWKHADPKRRGPIDQIEQKLHQAGARLRSTNSASADVLEALTTNGQRAIVMDGDITTVDYIAYSFLQKIGYTLHGWRGESLNTEDTDITDKKIILVPPGAAGEEILKIVTEAIQSSTN